MSTWKSNFLAVSEASESRTKYRNPLDFERNTRNCLFFKYFKYSDLVPVPCRNSAGRVFFYGFFFFKLPRTKQMRQCCDVLNQSCMPCRPRSTPVDCKPRLSAAGVPAREEWNTGSWNWTNIQSRDLKTNRARGDEGRLHCFALIYI